MRPTPRVLHLVTHATGGGIQTFVHSLADGLVARGWRSAVAYYRGDAPAPAAADYVRIEAGGALRRWPLAFARLVRSSRPDIVHLHGTTPGSLGALAARAVRHPRVVYTEHAVHADLPQPWRALRRATARLPHTSVAVCTATAASLVRHARIPPDRVVTIPYGTADADPLPPPHTGDLVYVAHFWPWKGHVLLLDAFAHLEPPLRGTLTFVGDGPERATIERAIDRLGLRADVRLTGETSDPWKHADGAWAYVHPSVRDASPLSILEALMRGLPVVASSVGGIPDLVSHNYTGLLFPPGDAGALAGRLERILSDRTLRDRMAADARAHALSHLRVETSVEAHLDLYRRLCDGPTPS